MRAEASLLRKRNKNNFATSTARVRSSLLDPSPSWVDSTHWALIMKSVDSTFGCRPTAVSIPQENGASSHNQAMLHKSLSQPDTISSQRVVGWGLIIMGTILLLTVVTLIGVTRDVSGVSRVPPIYLVLIVWLIPQGVQELRRVKQLIVLSQIDPTVDQSSYVGVSRKIEAIEKSSMYFNFLLALATLLVAPTIFVFSAAFFVYTFLEDRAELRETRSLISDAERPAHS